MDNCKIIIARKNSFWGCALKYRTELDGIFSGVLKNGSILIIPITPGQHILSFFIRGKTVKSIPIDVKENQNEINLFVKIDGRQNIIIERNDFSSPLHSFHDRENIPDKNLKSPVVLATVVTIALVFMAIVFIGSKRTTLDSADQEKSNDTQNNHAYESLAEEQLNLATTHFQEGDYMAAISICKEILSQYPDTSAAQNMENYLSAQYEQFPHFSAEELMNLYDENIVNADQEYTDTVLIVTGTVNSIGKTNHDTNLTVVLNSGTSFYGVQLNFKTTQTDSIASLSNGDSITAIGKCTGKSGKQLLILDGNNVMIENCYLIS